MCRLLFPYTRQRDNGLALPLRTDAMKLLSYQYFLIFLLLIFLPLATAGGRAEVPAASRQTSPDAVCVTCHQAIYTSYRKTPMARASGPAAEGLLPGEFTHAPSGVHYRLFLR